MATYVLVFGRLHRLEDKEAFEAAFERVSRTIVGRVSSGFLASGGRPIRAGVTAIGKSVKGTP